MPATTQVRQINIQVDASGVQGLKDVADKLGNMNKNVSSLASGMSNLQSAFLAYFSLSTAKELAGIADSMSLLQSRIDILVDSGKNGADILQSIGDSANRTATPIAQFGQNFLQVNESISQLGGTADAALALTELLADSFRASGVSAAQASTGITSLVQSFNTGQFSLRQLRSALAGNIEITKLLKDTYGDDLFKDVKSGAIKAADFIKVLISAQAKLKADAEAVAPTFSGTFTKAFNDFSLAINNVNQKLGLSGGFASAVSYLEEHIPQIGIAFAGVATVIAFESVPTIIAAVTKVQGAFLLLVTENPLVALAVVVATAFVTMSDSAKSVTDPIHKFSAALYDVDSALFSVSAKLDRVIAKIPGLGGLYTKFAEQDQSIADKDVDKAKKAREETNEIFGPSDGAIQAERQVRALKAFADQLHATYDNRTLKDILSDINKAFANGTDTLTEYYFKLNEYEKYKLDREFREGKIEVDKYVSSLEKLEEKNLNQGFANGAIAARDFHAAIEAIKINELDAQFHAGVINLDEYQAKLVEVSTDLQLGAALHTGFVTFSKSIGNLNQIIVNGITESFGLLETTLQSFFKTGKIDFASFTQSVLDEIEKIIIRMLILRPLLNGILGIGGGTSSSVTDNFGAVQRTSPGLGVDTNFGGIGTFQKSAVNGFSRSALSGVASGQNKATSGDVSVVVNNHADANVQTKTTTGPNGEKSIELLIHSKVKEGFATGTYDKSVQSAYGLSRKGS